MILLSKTIRTALYLVIFLFCFISFGQAEEIKWLKLRQEIGLEEIINAIFVPGDTTILVTDANYKLVELDASTGEVKREIPNIKGAIKFSDDQLYLYTYGWEKVKWPSGEIIGKYPKSFPVNNGTGFAINEKVGLLIGVEYGAPQYPWMWRKGIWVIDLNTYKLIDTLGFQQNYYRYIQLTDDGKYFITDALYVLDYTHPELNIYKRYIWDLKTLDTITKNSPIYKIKDQLGKIKTSPDGKWLCSVSESLVRVFDNNTFEKRYEWRVAPDSSGSLSAIDISSDSRYLVTGGSESKVADIHVWDLTLGQLVYNYKNGSEKVWGEDFLKFSQNGSYIMAYSNEGIGLFNNMLNSVKINPTKSEFTLYPNPTTGMLTFKSNYFQTGQLKIELFDLNGISLKVLFDDINTQKDLIFDISFIQNGIYLIQAKQNNTLKSFKVIKGK